jgi:uncharacterized repeat protein (TIGR03803 family)
MKQKILTSNILTKIIKNLAMATVFLATVGASAGQLKQLFGFNLIDGYGSAGETFAVSGGVLYGTTEGGNTNENCNPGLQGSGTGTIFKINTDGTGFTNLYNFSSDAIYFNSCANSDGAEPKAGLVLCSNALYGTAYTGGAYGNGTIFRINTDGTSFTNLHSFSAMTGGCNNDGDRPAANLILCSNTLYGTATEGGDYGWGTVFRINTDGTCFTNLHSFTDDEDPDNPDGAMPYGCLVLSGNTLYGTTTSGGSGSGQGGGIIFRVNTDGTGYTNLYNFSTPSDPGGINADGAFPTAGLTLVSNTLYGMAPGGGSYGGGTIFKINTDGTGFTDLFDFGIVVGGNVVAGGGGNLIYANNVLYGMADDLIFAIHTDGTGFGIVDYNSACACNDINTCAGDFLTLSGNTFYFGAPNSTNSWGALYSLAPSRPVINGIVLNTNSTVTISCSGDADLPYLMQATTNLAPPISWQTISTNVADTNGSWQFTDFSLTNTIYECLTNLVYTNSLLPLPGDINPPTPIGTNVSCGYVPAVPMRFYRAATMP